jgi:hypothetical protein
MSVSRAARFDAVLSYLVPVDAAAEQRPSVSDLLALDTSHLGRLDHRRTRHPKKLRGLSDADDVFHRHALVHSPRSRLTQEPRSYGLKGVSSLTLSDYPP